MLPEALKSVQTGILMRKRQLSLSTSIYTITRKKLAVLDKDDSLSDSPGNKVAPDAYGAFGHVRSIESHMYANLQELFYQKSWKMRISIVTKWRY